MNVYLQIVYSFLALNTRIKVERYMLTTLIRSILMDTLSEHIIFTFSGIWDAIFS